MIYFVYHQGQFETTDLLFRLFNLDVFNNFNRMNRHGWYISTIIGMYLIFALVYYLCSKLKTDKKFYIAGFIMVFLSVGFRIGAIIADNGGMYTREMPCFAIGCIYAMELIISVVPVQFAYYFFNFTIILDFLFTNLRYKLIKPRLAFHLKNRFSIYRKVYNCCRFRLLKRVISSNVIAYSPKVFHSVTPFLSVPSMY